MFHLLSSSEYSIAQPLLSVLRSPLIITAVLEGTSPGKLWVDDLTRPTSCFLQSAEGNFLVGNPHNEGFNLGFKALIPSLDDDHLVIECDSDDWRVTLDQFFEKRIVMQPRLYYEFNDPLLDWRSLVPGDMAMLSVDADFLQRTTLKNMPAVLDAVKNNWFSQQDFLKDGFGRCLVHEATIVSWCMVDCVSGIRCEIGIHTDAAYRKKGYAALTVRAAIEAAHSAGYTIIGWHCWQHNLASRAVAEKVGFKLMHPYDAYVCVEDDANYAIEVGVMAARAGNHREALEFYQSAGDAPWAYFLAARSHAALAENELALNTLRQALDHGWNAPDYLLGDEFKPLHTLSGWHALVTDPRLHGH